VIALDILHLVDRMETLLINGRRIPLSSSRIVNEEPLLDIIDQMRISIPEEIKRAKRVQQERDRIVAQANEEAERIVALAREEAARLVSEHVIVQAAKARAEDLLAQAERDAQAIKDDADAYVLEVLGELENRLERLLTIVRNGIITVQERMQQRQAGMASQPGPEATSQEERGN